MTTAILRHLPTSRARRAAFALQLQSRRTGKCVTIPGLDQTHTSRQPCQDTMKYAYSRCGPVVSQREDRHGVGMARAVWLRHPAFAAATRQSVFNSCARDYSPVLFVTNTDVVCNVLKPTIVTYRNAILGLARQCTTRVGSPFVQYEPNSLAALNPTKIWSLVALSSASIFY